MSAGPSTGPSSFCSCWFRSALLAAVATVWLRALSLASAPWMRAAWALLALRLVRRPAMVCRGGAAESRGRRPRPAGWGGGRGFSAVDRGDLVCRPGEMRAKSLELLQDRIRRGGPVERCLGLVVGGHELLDFGDQFLLWRWRCWFHRSRMPHDLCTLQD
jgi:hypothetical protein